MFDYDWDDDEEADVNDDSDFGALKIDVFVKRVRDGKVAHVLGTKCDFTREHRPRGDFDMSELMKCGDRVRHQSTDPILVPESRAGSANEGSRLRRVPRKGPIRMPTST